LSIARSWAEDPDCELDPSIQLADDELLVAGASQSAGFVEFVDAVLPLKTDAAIDDMDDMGDLGRAVCPWRDCAARLVKN
jgi:hypothetical protein